MYFVVFDCFVALPVWVVLLLGGCGLCVWICCFVGLVLWFRAWFVVCGSCCLIVLRDFAVCLLGRLVVGVIAWVI